jgi:hypothetical protein
MGTLIGAFIIAVIQNGMNLTNIASYTQMVVHGLVILAAVLVDRLLEQVPLPFVFGGFAALAGLSAWLVLQIRVPSDYRSW